MLEVIFVHSCVIFCQISILKNAEKIEKMSVLIKIYHKKKKKEVKIYMCYYNCETHWEKNHSDVNFSPWLIEI